jgi:hypothetical protein
LDAIYANQSQINNKALVSIAPEKYPEILWDNYVSKIAPQYGRDKFLADIQGLDKTSKIWNQGRNLFKYAAARGVYSTPQYMVNDANIFNGESLKAEDWNALFAKIIKE